MKYLVSGLLLSLWLVVTAMLAITIIGLAVVLIKDSGWCDIPKSLLKTFET